MSSKCTSTFVWNKLCKCLGNVRLSRLIGILLMVFIATGFIAHYYLVKIGSDASDPVHRSRSKLDHPDDGSAYMISNLNLQIDELKRIKASVNNELRELENKRLKIQEEISNYHSQIDLLRVDHDSTSKEVAKLKLSLEQLKLEKQQVAERYMPIMKAPFKVMLGNNIDKELSPPRSSKACKMFSCFDYSRCPLSSGFSVYVYNPEMYSIAGILDEFTKMSFLSNLDSNPYITKNPGEACIYLLLVGEVQQNHVEYAVFENTLKQLPYWQGDGRNHLLLNLARNPHNIDLFGSIQTGRALIAQSSFVETLYRPDFDSVIPINLGIVAGETWRGLPFLSPVRRKFLISFWGEFQSHFSIHDGGENLKNDNLLSDLFSQQDDPNYASNIEGYPQKTKMSNIDSTTQLLSFEHSVVSSLKEIPTQTSPSDGIFFQFNCEGGETIGINGEWKLCGNEQERAQILKQSTFSLIIAPSNISYISTTVFQNRFYESLKYGAIPVILGNQMHLPYEEIISWHRAVIVLPKARTPELHFLIRTFMDTDISEMRRHCRLYWETYFSSTKSIIDSVLAGIRTRLLIPPAPIKNEPAHSFFNSSYVQPRFEGAVPDSETDEILGPVELPYPSLQFKQNFSKSVMLDAFKNPGDPFRMYPFLPDAKSLPSEAKFLGSGFDFRPVNKGEGGAGKEFGEALGGNMPREQFTIVMLTYERESVLISALQRLKGLPFLNKVLVIWNSPSPPSPDLRWPEIDVPIHVVKTLKNSLNNRFLPYDAIETESILSIDDDAHLRHDEIVFGFRVWREERDRIVGFPGRFHAWDLKSGAWLYNSNYSCELSMVITGAAFFHKYYTYLYSYVMPQAIRDKVDEYINCEDIALNFLVSHITRKPPVKVTSRWTFRCPGCPKTLSNDTSHFEERHKCMNFFNEVYGYMPLYYTQYRVDSVLFKTRLPHDKQKCFKFI